MTVNSLLSPKRLGSIAVPIALAMLIASQGCGNRNTFKASAAGPVPTVVVAPIEQRTVPLYSEYVGQTKANETVELRARVAGILQKIYFKEGSRVRKGELLFRIDPREYQAALQSANAALGKANSDLAQARQRTDVLQAQAQLTEAQAQHSKAQQDLDRITPLVQAKAVTELEYDAAVAAEKTTKATVDARQANLTNLEAAVKYTIERAQSEVSAAKAKVTEAQLELSYCSIYSPITGIIGLKQVDQGNLVGKGEATLLATVSSSEPLLVGFNLSENEYLKIAPREKAGQGSGLKFELILSDNSVHPETGTFKVIDRTVDPTTGTIRVEASFPNPGSYLRPGQFARVRVAVANAVNAILVPRLAIQELQGAKTVTVVGPDNKTSLRTITVGDQSGSYYIVLKGLEAGERVIVEGMQKVKPGGEVNPTAAPPGAETEQPVQK
jgi:membrane fusion protein (multidrug efflux system)